MCKVVWICSVNLRKFLASETAEVRALYDVTAGHTFRCSAGRTLANDNRDVDALLRIDLAHTPGPAHRFIVAPFNRNHFQVFHHPLRLMFDLRRESSSLVCTIPSCTAVWLNTGSDAN